MRVNEFLLNIPTATLSQQKWERTLLLKTHKSTYWQEIAANDKRILCQQNKRERFATNIKYFKNGGSKLPFVQFL